MGGEEMDQIGDLIHAVVEAPDDEAHLASVEQRVGELCQRFPLYPDLP